jgi:hypothetical protein
MDKAKKFKEWFRQHTGHSFHLKAAHDAIIDLEDKIITLEFMIESGLGYEDLQRDA